MKAQIRHVVLMACAAALPSAAFAQAQPAPAAAQAGVLEEVVITAQKRVEKLQDVPVAASVVATDALTKVNAGDITDLNNLVPSVNMNATINGRVPIGMRGISSNANEATVGLASGVAIMIDGVPVPSDSYAGNQLDDIAKVEVLKGPQATLGGRTAAAGVINLVTRGPSAHLTGSAALTLTDDHEYRASGFIAGPISDTVQYSVAAYGNTRDYPITNLATGDKTDQKTYGVRGKLLFKPNENLDITLMGRYAQAKSEGFNFVYTYLTPGAYLLFGTAVPPFPPFLAGVPPTVSQATLMAGVTPSANNLVYNSPVRNAGADIKDKDASLIIDYRMGDLTLTSTTAYQHETQTNIQDLFAVATYFSNEFRQAFQDGFALIGLTPPYPPGSPPTTSPAVWADFDNTQTQNIDVRQVSAPAAMKMPSNT